MNDNFDVTEGARRKDDELQRLAKLRALHVNRGRRALLTALLAHGTGTADDVRAALDLPAAVNPVCLGAVAPPLAKAGIITLAGFAQTRRPKAHARPLSVWALSDRAAAEQWLADHPDQSDDDDQGAVQTTLWV
ncbi:MAG TPA: hypothetical protein VNH11_07255 [Pirellulales bacterium]|nr:hypothetical protein [Pirellulales bacterium]